MKKRKFADGGALEDLAEGKAKGRFDEDIYKRARAAMEKGDKEEVAAEEKRTVRSVRPKPNVADTGDETARMAKRAPAPASASNPRQAEVPEPIRAKAGIPTDRSARAPASTGAMPGELERNLRNTAAALTPVGVGAAMRGAKAASEAASAGFRAGRPAAAIARNAPRAGDEALEAAVSQMARRPAAKQVAPSAQRFTPKQEVEAAESTMRGAAGRRAVQEARRERLGADRLQKDLEPAMGYAKGGKVRGDGLAQRGKTKGRFV